mgnify:CR=1 FL=1
MNHTIKTDIESIDTVEMLLEVSIDNYYNTRDHELVENMKKALNIVRLIKKENSNWLTLEIASLKLNAPSSIPHSVCE